MGALIGVERDLRRRPAGVRTSMFVCLATCLFTVLSTQLSHAWGDTSPTRIASNIVQGIGFLGAGAILKEGGGLVGLTTAATVFVEAAIGMAAGGGYYAIAGATTGIVLFALVVLAWGTERLHVQARGLLFRLSTSHAESIAGEVQQLLATLRVAPHQFRVSMVGTNSIVEFQAEVSHLQESTIVDKFNRQGVVMEIVPSNGHHE